MGTGEHMKRICQFLACAALLLGAALLAPRAAAVYADTIAHGVAAESGFRTVAVAAGQTAQLSAPAGYSSLTWRSSAPSVASVDQHGRVTALCAGTAVITAEGAADSGIFENWMVQVGGSSGSLSLDAHTCGLTVGQSQLLAASYTGASGGRVTWSTTDASVASVDETGRITAVAPGSAVIYATASDGATASCMVYVIEPTRKMSKASAELPAGQTLYNLSYELDVGKVLWTSSNPTAATACRGFIEAAAEGTTTVTAIMPDGTGAQCSITVTRPEPVFSAYLDPNNPQAGVENTLVVVGSPAYSALRIQLKNSDGRVVQTLTPTGGYTDREINGRVVRIWNTKLTIADAGSYTVVCGAENSNRAFSFQTLVTAASDEAETGRVQSWGTSTELLHFLTQYEGLCQQVIYDVVGYPTIGYGRALFYGDTFYNNQSIDEAWGNMCEMVGRIFVPAVNRFVTNNGLKLNQPQFDALVSYSYNNGAYCWFNYSFKLKNLLIAHPDVNEIDRQELKYAFGKQSWSGGVFWPGLFRRRIDEWEMFTTGDYAQHPYGDYTGEFEWPSDADQRDPNKYGSDWKYLY